MHTRSQPLPPDGLQSLETPRRRRTAKVTASSNVAEQGPSNTRRRATHQKVASQKASQPAEERPSEATEQNAATIIAEDHIPPDQAIPQDFSAHSPRPETISEASVGVTTPGAASIDIESPDVPPGENLSSHT